MTQETKSMGGSGGEVGAGERPLARPPGRLPGECDLVLLWTDRDGETPGEDSLRAIGGGR